MAQRQFNQTFTIPLTAGNYAPEIVRFAPPAFDAAGRYAFEYACKSVVANVIAAVATAVLEIWLCQAGLDPTLDASYAFYATIANGGTLGGASVQLTDAGQGPVGVQIRGKSGGTNGTAQASLNFG